MADSFRLKLYTPAGVAFEGDVLDVTVPVSDGTVTHGEIGILPNHAKYTGLLGTGLIEYRLKEGSERKRAVISGGFCSFSNNTLAVLSDSIDTTESVDPDRYSTEREALRSFVAGSDGYSDEWAIAAAKLARIDAIEKLLR